MYRTWYCIKCKLRCLQLMRAKEFISERRGTNLKQGKMPHTAEKASPGSLRNNGYYDLYRASMAMAAMDADGNAEHDMDPSSWIAGDGYVGGYTDEEEKLAQDAFKSIGLNMQVRHASKRQPRIASCKHRKSCHSI